MTKKFTNADYAKRYEEKRQQSVVELARAWAAQKGEAFVIFVGSMPLQFSRDQDSAVESARAKVRAGLYRQDQLSIKRIKV
jgi:hypothetical protein